MRSTCWDSVQPEPPIMRSTVRSAQPPPIMRGRPMSRATTTLITADHAWTTVHFVHTLQVGPREHEIPLAPSVVEAARPTNQATTADSRPPGKSGESGAVRIQKVLWGPHQLAVSAVLRAIRSVGDHAHLHDLPADRFRHRSLGVDAVSMSTEMTRSVDGGKDRHRTVRDS